MVDKKSKNIREMFNSISPRYDFLNHLLSFGFDIYWRKKTRKKLEKLCTKENPLILDLCSGTGDLSIELSKIGRVIGVDFAEKMLKIGILKVREKELEDKIFFVNGDGLKLPFKDNSFDIVTVAFGVRNFEDPGKGLEEIKRVLKYGGVFGILEFSKPENKLFEKLFSIYFHNFLPLIGNTISKNNFAYKYLPLSVKEFPEHKTFKNILISKGFKDVNYRLFFKGISVLFYGKK